MRNLTTPEVSPERFKYTVAVDFDGVIHKYSRGRHDNTIYDPPHEGAMESLEEMHLNGYTIIIFSARALEQTEQIREWMRKWWKEKCRIPYPDFEITAFKVPAKVYIDDRGLRFTNWEDMRRYFV